MSDTRDDDSKVRHQRLRQSVSTKQPLNSPDREIAAQKSLSELAEVLYRPLYQFLNSEEAQNLLLPETLRQPLLDGEDCDEIPGASGEFGRSASNPIPVNGVMGQLIYLSLLRRAGETPVMFHRLGSCASSVATIVDKYEVLSLDFSVREVLYLDMYHPRKSRKAPTGYSLLVRSSPPRRSDLDPDNPIYGVHHYLSDFPQNLDRCVRRWSIESLGAPLSVRRISASLAKLAIMQRASASSPELSTEEQIIRTLKRTIADLEAQVLKRSKAGLH